MARPRKTRTSKRTALAASGEPTKAEAIREAAKTLGKKVRPKDIIAELAKEGITVSSAQVSSTLLAAGYRRRRRGKKAAVAAAAPAAASSNGLNLDGLLAAKALILKVGSVKAAHKALEAMKKLG